MNRKLTGFLFVAALSAAAIPQAVAGGKRPAKAAAKAACKPERAALGAGRFRAIYGAQPVVACRRLMPDDAREAIRNAAQECRAERAADLGGFREQYGTNPSKGNAFGTCVSRTKAGDDPGDGEPSEEDPGDADSGEGGGEV
jgi:hypothetical protein